MTDTIPVPATHPDSVARNADIVGRPARIPPLAPEELTDEIRAITAEMKVAAGVPPSDYIPDYMATVLRHPALHRGHSDLALLLMAHGTLCARDRELAILRTGWLCQAPFEWNSHVEMARRLTDISDAEIERTTVGSSAPGWGEHDRAVIRAVEELHADAMIADATWAVLERTLDARQLIELPILVGQYMGVAFLQNSLRVALMPGHVGLSAR